MLARADSAKPEQIHLETRRDSIHDLSGTPFALAITEICREKEAEIVLFPLHAEFERSLGLDPDEQASRIARTLSECKKVRKLPDARAWIDRIHWNETGRRAMAAELIKPSLL